jgi:methyl-accepting chemotaxis protein
MFKNSSIYTRLVLLISIIVIAFVGSSLIGWLGFQAAKHGLEDVYQGSVEEILQVNIMRGQYEIEIIDVVQKIRDGLLSWKEGEEKIRRAINRIDAALISYLQAIKQDYRETEIPTDLQKHIENLERRTRDSLPDLKRLQEIVKRQDKEALSAFATQELYPMIDPITIEIDHLIRWHVAETRNDYHSSLSHLAFNQNLMLIVFILALALSIATALFTIFSILKPLKVAIQAMRKIAGGEVLDVAIEIENETADEVGQFLQALRNMINYKKKIIEALKAVSFGELNIQVETRSDKDVLSKSINQMIASSKKMAEILTIFAQGNLNIAVQPRSDHDEVGLALVSMLKKLKQIIGSIQSDIASLSTSAEEISVSVSQVATGSSETATAVAETTTTVEELKQTAQIAAEKAKEVLSSAEETLQIVKNCEKLLQNTIDDMSQINDKMRIISEGIIKLSELGQTIGEIIDSVNDLAEQSNLLAVNAAIEAAKAGEQGKGFGVVAQEIRTLAEQSKAATVQVRAILNDIQNATSSAVLATEQGSKAVDKGVSQSVQTNEAMRTLVASMSHVAQAANQIAISSQQQLVAVDQVTLAMNNINEASNQHVENMKKIENAIFALSSIGRTLKQIVAQFNLASSVPQAEPTSFSPQYENHEEGSVAASSDKLFSLSGSS